MGQNNSNAVPAASAKTSKAKEVGRPTNLVQPEGMANSSRSNRGSSHAQIRQPKWRKNYQYQMSSSLPTHPSSKRRKKHRQTERLTKSLHTSSAYKINNHHNTKHGQQKLLKLLKKCTQNIDTLVSKSYVDSMRSYDSELSVRLEAVSKGENLIELDYTDSHESYPHRYNNKRMRDRREALAQMSFEKNYSEIALRSDETEELNRLHQHRQSVHHEDDLMTCSENYDHRKVCGTQKLCFQSGYSSSYVNESSYDEHTTPYASLVRNGHSTPFLTEDEDTNHMSFYYDDEFIENGGPIQKPLDNSDLEAAICNQYASLLDKASDQLERLHIDGDQSHLSSDFENIFQASLTRNEVSYDVDSMPEEGALDMSVPNYTDMTAATKPEYQLAFPASASMYSDGRSVTSATFDREVLSGTTPRHRLANQVPKPPRLSRSANKRVSFSNEVLNETSSCDGSESGLDSSFDEVGNSTTWLEMKRNYTTWGQVKVKKEEPRKSKSVEHMPTNVKMRRKREAVPYDEAPEHDQKRYSLTLWEMYKRTHSMSLSASTSELTTPQAFLDPPVSAGLKQSIDNLLDDVLKPKSEGEPPKSTVREPASKIQPLPDISFLKETKHSLQSFNWWSEVFSSQPSFCDRRTVSDNYCNSCDRRPSNDHTVIVFQGNGPEPHKLCQLSFLNQMFNAPASQPCTCTREKMYDMSSSGIATGSSGVTPREPNSWQHIAEYLKKRQRSSADMNSRGSLNSTLSDQQLLDVVGLIEAADMLGKCQQNQNDSGNNMHTNEMVMRVWKLVSALECVLGLGLKSHKLVSVPMGRIRTRVSIWDVVDESCKSAGQVNGTFEKILKQITTHKVEDVTVRFCLFVVGLLNSQMLDFWLQLVQHNAVLMDKFYQEDSFLRSKNMGDKKLQSEVMTCLHQLSFHTWDIDYRRVLDACQAVAPDRDPIAENPTPIKKSATTPHFQRTCYPPPRITLL